jgi:enoyl-[acyl-carrier protein] reductase/trans-2-enoyl-CoA reductase (NAD+)
MRGIKSTETIATDTDFVGYKAEFLRLFGFGLAGVDYEAEVNPVVDIKGMVE